jgi:hypothetical protein
LSQEISSHDEDKPKLPQKEEEEDTKEFYRPKNG